ncbi:MAG: aminomethyltransferase family protein [Chloroflexota bacterium]
MSTQDSSQKLVYADAHPTVRLSGFRFEQSPFIEKYLSDQILFAIYCERFYPLSIGEDVVEAYWKLRQGVLLYDVPEKPLEIKGPDAVTLLEKVFTRPIDTLKVWRARYAIACTADGNVLMDGVLIRLAADYFWYVKANGEFETWLKAHAAGLDVVVSDPHSRVLQIQGPKSLEVLKAAVDEPVPDTFGYFHAGMFTFAGQELLVSRTGWTGEMGIEVYTTAATDHHALWDHLLECGNPYGLEFGSASSMGIRRIEAGILDYGTDIEPDMTPYAASLGAFVDLDKPDFIGKSALEIADKTNLLFGVVCESATPVVGSKLSLDDTIVGHVLVGEWSLTLDKGIAYVRFYAPHADQDSWLGETYPELLNLRFSPLRYRAGAPLRPFS